MRWKEPSERHNDDLIDAIDRAAARISHTLAEGFKLVVLHLGAGQGVDNSAAIEAATKKLRDLTAQLNKSTSP